jgi:hypothetical protein
MEISRTPRSAQDFGLLDTSTSCSERTRENTFSSRTIQSTDEPDNSDSFCLVLLEIFKRSREWSHMLRVLDEFIVEELASAAGAAETGAVLSESFHDDLGKRVRDTVSACVEHARGLMPYNLPPPKLTIDTLQECVDKTNDSSDVHVAIRPAMPISRRVRSSFMGVVALVLPPAHLQERLRHLALVERKMRTRSTSVSFSVETRCALAGASPLKHPLQPEQHTIFSVDAALNPSVRARAATLAPVLKALHQPTAEFSGTIVDAAAPSDLHRVIPSEAFELLSSCIEGSVMRHLHRATHAICSTDLADDAKTHARLRALQWLPPSALHVPAGVGTLVLRLASHDLRRMTLAVTPEDKLSCLLSACQVLFRALAQDLRRITGSNVLSLSGGSTASTDEVLPAFIFSVLQANPKHLVSSINYMERYRDKQQMIGKAGYCFTVLKSSVVYLCELGSESIAGIPSPEFVANCEAAAAGKLASWLDSQPALRNSSQ